MFRMFRKMNVNFKIYSILSVLLCYSVGGNSFRSKSRSKVNVLHRTAIFEVRFSFPETRTKVRPPAPISTSLTAHMDQISQSTYVTFRSHFVTPPITSSPTNTTTIIIYTNSRINITKGRLHYHRQRESTFIDDFRITVSAYVSTITINLCDTPIVPFFLARFYAPLVIYTIFSVIRLSI